MASNGPIGEISETSSVDDLNNSRKTQLDETIDGPLSLSEEEPHVYEVRADRIVPPLNINPSSRDPIYPPELDFSRPDMWEDGQFLPDSLDALDNFDFDAFLHSDSTGNDYAPAAEPVYQSHVWPRNQMSERSLAAFEQSSTWINAAFQARSSFARTMPTKVPPHMASRAPNLKGRRGYIYDKEHAKRTRLMGLGTKKELRQSINPSLLSGYEFTNVETPRDPEPVEAETSSTSAPVHAEPQTASKHFFKPSMCDYFVCAYLVTGFLSLVLALWQAVAHKDVSAGFTLGAYVLGIGSSVVMPLHHRHNKRCRCDSDGGTLAA